MDTLESGWWNIVIVALLAVATVGAFLTDKGPEGEIIVAEPGLGMENGRATFRLDPDKRTGPRGPVDVDDMPDPPARPSDSPRPTSTPDPAELPYVTPAPPTVTLANRDGYQVVLDVAGGDRVVADRLWYIADCESGWKLTAGWNIWEQNATAVGSQGEVSAWQIHPVHHWRFDPQRLRMDLAYAAQAALALGEESGWSGPWVRCGY